MNIDKLQNALLGILELLDDVKLGTRENKLAYSSDEFLTRINQINNDITLIEDTK